MTHETHSLFLGGNLCDFGAAHWKSWRPVIDIEGWKWHDLDPLDRGFSTIVPYEFRISGPHADILSLLQLLQHPIASLCSCWCCQHHNFKYVPTIWWDWNTNAMLWLAQSGKVQTHTHSVTSQTSPLFGGSTALSVCSPSWANPKWLVPFVQRRRKPPARSTKPGHGSLITTSTQRLFIPTAFPTQRNMTRIVSCKLLIRNHQPVGFGRNDQCTTGGVHHFSWVNSRRYVGIASVNSEKRWMGCLMI